MGFANPLAALTDLDVHDLGIFLAEARSQNWIILLTLKRAKQWAGRLRLGAANPGAEINLSSYGNRDQICQPITAPLISNPDFVGADAIGQAQDVP